MHLSLPSGPLHYFETDSEWGSRQTTELILRQSWILTMLFGDSVHTEFSFLVYVFQALFGFRGLFEGNVKWTHIFLLLLSCILISEHFPSCSSNCSLKQAGYVVIKTFVNTTILPWSQFFLQMSTWFIPSHSPRLCSCFILLAKTILFPQFPFVFLHSCF